MCVSPQAEVRMVDNRMRGNSIIVGWKTERGTERERGREGGKGDRERVERQIGIMGGQAGGIRMG